VKEADAIAPIIAASDRHELLQHDSTPLSCGGKPEP
jgi:hypothetical protein